MPVHASDRRTQVVLSSAMARPQGAPPTNVGKRLRTPPVQNSALLKKAFVIALLQLRFDLLDGVESDTHHDEQRRATEEE